MNTQIRPLWAFLADFRVSQNSSKKSAPSVLSIYGPSTFCKIWKKKFNSQFWEKCCKNGQMGKLAHFRASENFPKKFSSVSFKYLWSLNFKQNIKKKLICQSWERCCGKKWMYIQMDRPKFIGPSQSMGPKNKSKLKCETSEQIWANRHSIRIAGHIIKRSSP